jgi:hypothetical protein
MDKITRIQQIENDVREARKDISLGFMGSADMILSTILSDLEKLKHDDDRRLDHALSEAHTTIGTFFDDLRAIYEPKEGSNHHG